MKLHYLKLFGTLIMFTVFAKNSIAVSFIGLEWGVNNDWRPNLIIGVKQNNNKNFDSEKTSSKVSGWGTAISFSWEGIDRIKVFRVEGVSYLQVEAGFGYSIVSEVPLLNFGIQTRGASDSDISILKSIIADIDLLFDGDKIGHLGISDMRGY